MISQIDDLYFLTITSEPLKDAVINDKPIIKVTTRQIREKKLRNRCWNVARGMYKVQRFIFAVYFYFSPFVVLLVAYYAEKAVIPLTGDGIKLICDGFTN